MPQICKRRRPLASTMRPAIRLRTRGGVMILRRTKFTAVLACALVATCRPGDAADPEHVSQWPLYQGGPGFSGHSPDESVKPPLKLVWSYRLDGDASGDAGGGVTV